MAAPTPASAWRGQPTFSPCLPPAFGSHNITEQIPHRCQLLFRFSQQYPTRCSDVSPIPLYAQHLAHSLRSQAPNATPASAHVPTPHMHFIIQSVYPALTTGCQLFVTGPALTNSRAPIPPPPPPRLLLCANAACQYINCAQISHPAVICCNHWRYDDNHWHVYHVARAGSSLITLQLSAAYLCPNRAFSPSPSCSSLVFLRLPSCSTAATLDHASAVAAQVGYIGIPLAIISIIYLITFGYWVLPDTGAGMLGQVHSSLARFYFIAVLADKSVIYPAGSKQLRAVCHRSLCG